MRIRSLSNSNEESYDNFSQIQQSYDIPEYFKGPRSYVIEISSSPQRLPKHYRQNLLQKIGGNMSKTKEKGATRNSQWKINSEAQRVESEDKLEQQRQKIEKNINKTAEQRSKQLFKRVQNVSKHLNHVQELNDRNKKEQKAFSRKLFTDLTERKKEMFEFMGSREKFSQSFTSMHQERIHEFEEQKKDEFEKDFEKNIVKNNIINEKLQQTVQKREFNLSLKAERLSQKTKQKEKKTEKNRSIHNKTVESFRLTKLAEKLSRIDLNCNARKKSNEIVSKHFKDIWEKKYSTITSNQQQLKQELIEKNNALTMKLNSSPVSHRLKSKINTDDSITRVLTNHSKIKEKQEEKKKELLTEHQQYTQSNKILKEVADKFNDFTRKANFLAKLNKN